MLTWAVIGAGHWGTALAVYLARQGRSVRLWGHNPDHLPGIPGGLDLAPLFPGLRRPHGLMVVPDWRGAVHGADVLLLAVPSHALRSLLRSRIADRGSAQTLVLASKGLERDGGARLDLVVAEEWPDRDLVVLSGPTFAADLVHGKPLAMALASKNLSLAEALAAELRSNQLRIYPGMDVAGVCLAGAIKNVLAIAAGISDGLENGDSARAALITRGLAELHRLGTALGGRTETFMGLAGAGDLILTAASDLSRNRQFGLGIGRGEKKEAILERLGQEVEGVHSSFALFHLAQQLGIEMPITEHVYRVLYEGEPPAAASRALMCRGLA